MERSHLSGIFFAFALALLISENAVDARKKRGAGRAEDFRNYKRERQKTPLRSSASASALHDDSRSTKRHTASAIGFSSSQAPAVNNGPCCQTHATGCDPNKKYYFYTDAAVTFYEAGQRCADRNQTFSVVNCKAEEDQMERVVLESKYYGADFHIGGFIWEDKIWRWAAALATPIKYFKWAPEQPNYNYKDRRHDRCAAASLVDQTFGYGWKVVMCLQDKFYMCQDNPCPGPCN